MRQAQVFATDLRDCPSRLEKLPGRLAIGDHHSVSRAHLDHAVSRTGHPAVDGHRHLKLRTCQAARGIRGAERKHEFRECHSSPGAGGACPPHEIIGGEQRDRGHAAGRRDEAEAPTCSVHLGSETPRVGPGLHKQKEIETKEVGSELPGRTEEATEPRVLAIPRRGRDLDAYPLMRTKAEGRVSGIPGHIHHAAVPQRGRAIADCQFPQPRSSDRVGTEQIGARRRDEQPDREDPLPQWPPVSRAAVKPHRTGQPPAAYCSLQVVTPPTPTVMVLPPVRPFALVATTETVKLVSGVVMLKVLVPLPAGSPFTVHWYE